LLPFSLEFWNIQDKEHRLRGYENRELRRIFGQKRNKVAGGWRKVHNEELHNLYSSRNIIKFIKSRRAWHVGRMGEKRKAYRLLVEIQRERDH
jgi:hypothetical protein